MTSDSTVQNKSTSSGAMLAQRVAIAFAGSLFMAAILFVTAGTLRWTAAWVYSVLYTIIMVYMMWYLQKTDPGLMDERMTAQKQTGTKKWDLLLVQLIKTSGGLATIIVAGLEFRNSWTAGVPLWLVVVGGLLFVVGNAIGIWAMAANTYFSSHVRIQDERGHQPVSAGPYKFVRHPGYVGFAMFFIGTPLLLESWWGLVPAGLAFVLQIVRTALEDRTLQAELPGYAEYAQQTRYRLIPGLW